MRDFFEILKARRSTRAFTTEQVSREEIAQIIEAGIWAPTGMGRMAYHFVAIHNPEKCLELARVIAEADNRGEGYCFYNAPSHIILSYDREVATRELDGGAIMQNMLLATEALGLGGCWINQIRVTCDQPAVRAKLTELGVPENHVVLGSIALGHIEKPTAAKPRPEGVVTFID